MSTVSAGPRVGLVLGSGGLAGTAFHAGVLTALAEAGWDARTAEVVVGTSAGSTAAALLRAGFPPADYVARVARRPLSPEGRRVLADLPQVTTPPPGPPRASWAARRPVAPHLALHAARRPWRLRVGTVAAGLLPAGTRPTDEIVGGLARLHPGGWPADPLWICAVRLSDGRRTVFGRDADSAAGVGEAVAASCAIPGYFEPVTIGDARYVDGGAHSLCNVDLVAGLGLDVVLVSAPMSSGSWLTARPDVGVRAAVRAQLGAEVRAVRRSGTPVVVLAPTAADLAAMGHGGMDASRRPAIADQVLASVRARLASDDALLRRLAGPG